MVALQSFHGGYLKASADGTLCTEKGAIRESQTFECQCYRFQVGQRDSLSAWVTQQKYRCTRFDHIMGDVSYRCREGECEPILLQQAINGAIGKSTTQTTTR